MWRIEVLLAPAWRASSVSWGSAPNPPEASVTRSSVIVGSTAAILCTGIGIWYFAGSRAPSKTFPPEPARVQPIAGHHSGVVHFDLLAQLLADDRRSKQSTDWLQELSVSKSTYIPTQAHALVGKPAPDFTLTDHQERSWSLHSQLPKGPVVLIFYLGKTCAACMHEMVEVNADIHKFHSLGAEVVAISGDGPAQSKRLQTEFGALSFPVLADPDHRVAHAFDAMSNTQPAQPIHQAMIVSRTGLISWVHSGDAPLRNNNALLYELARLEQRLPENSMKPAQLVEQSKP